jgi:predicted phage-related endonuclease
MSQLTRDELKANGLGASEVAAIFGEPSPWMTASDVWLDRMGMAPAKIETAPMVTGRALETSILRLAADELGMPFRHNAAPIRHPDWPDVPLFATPDGYGPKRHVLAEVKLVGRRFADWQDGAPGYVRAQVAAQLACVRPSREAVVIALVGAELRTFRVERDRAIEDALVERVASWWRTYIDGQLAPDPDTPDAAWRLFGATADTSAARLAERIATPDEQVTGQELLRVGAAIGELERRQDELRRSLAERATDSDVLGLGWRASWRQRADVSWKGVSVDAGATPELIEAHTRRSSSFVFRALGSS